MESSSVRVEIAEKIMISNLYTVGLWLKSLSDADEALKEIKETNISIQPENQKRLILKSCDLMEDD